MRLLNNGYLFEIDGVDLVVTQSGRPCMRLPLVPRIEGENPEAGSWEELDAEHFHLPLANFGGVHLAVREGHVCYWVETDRKHARTLTYFPDSRPTDTRWHTFLSDELDRTWTVNENADVPISCSYVEMHVDGEDGAGMTDRESALLLWIPDAASDVMYVRITYELLRSE